MAEEAPVTIPPPSDESATPDVVAHEAPAAVHQTEEENSSLMGSAKTLAEAAQLAASKKTGEIDKEKVSEAAEDILEAAKSGMKLDDKEGVGQYLGKAEGYLHSMHGSHDGKADADKPKDTETETEKKEESSGGVGGLMKMAGGFFK